MKTGKGMGLRKFVQDVLVEVITGVHEAAEHVRTQHVADLGLRGAVNTEEERSEVQFDVAVTVSYGGKGEVGLHVPFVGSKGEVSAAKQSVNRVKFSVPVAFASQPVGPEYTRSNAPSPPLGETRPTGEKGG